MHAINRRLGTLEVEDQIEAARYVTRDERKHYLLLSLPIICLSICPSSICPSVCPSVYLFTSCNMGRMGSFLGGDCVILLSCRFFSADNLFR